MNKKRMKAAVLYELKKPLVIEENIEIPQLRSGQVLVKLVYSGICRSQLMEVQGCRGTDPYLPHLLGHEGSGIVVETGNEVKKVTPGDKVALTWIKGVGADEGGTLYTLNNTIINSGPVTTFNEYSVVSENRLVRIPEGIPLDIASLFGCAVPTGAGIIINEIKPVPKSNIAIFGLGGIGLSALMMAKLYDPNVLIAIDTEKNKLDLAEKLGATHTIDALKCDSIKEINKITKNKGVDYSVEAAGTTTTIEQAFESISRQGLCIFASHPQTGEKISLDPHHLISGKQIRGSWGGATRPDRDIPIYANYYLEGKLPLDIFLGHTFKLHEINHALGSLEKGIIPRALIEISNPR